MSRRFVRALLLALVIGAGTAAAYQSHATRGQPGAISSPIDRPWPPEVQPVSDESPPLAAEQALQTFYMPPGYRVELVASEPLVQEPVALDWDIEGRLWVVEMPGYMPNITAAGELNPIGRVVVLQDKNGDGRMDSRTVFAERLVLARAIKILDRGVLVGEPPNVWLMRDTNGDLRSDTKELVTNRYGDRNADPQYNANGFFWALDNRMYTAGHADIYLRLKNGTFDVQRTLPRGEWGVTQDDAGRIYRNTNESAVHVDLVPTTYYVRNPNLLRTRGSYERLATGNEELNVIWPVRPNPGTNRAYQTGIDRPDGTLVKFTAVCAPLVYRGDHLPHELYGNVFVAEPAANLVSRIVLEDDGSRVTARKAYARGEFLASTDERFRPVFLSDAPDGTISIADLYRGIIEHRLSMTEYLRDQILARKLEQPTGFGRIYRVVHTSTKRDLSRPLVGAAAARLVSALSHPNGWWRQTAQRLLVERNERSAIPALKKLTQNASNWRVRLHALWTLDGLDAIEPAVVMKALEDASREVRTSAVRIAERWLAEPHPIHTAILKRLDDPDPTVQHQLAASLGAMQGGARERALTAILERYGNDPVTLDAALSGLRGSEGRVLEQLLAGAQQSGKAQRLNGRPQPAIRPEALEHSVTMLAATLVRSAQDADVQNLLGFIADAGRPAWQRSALLRGAEVALLGAAMPGAVTPQRGTPVTSGVSLPCPTCPGGRGGPGGAYAFPRPANTTPPSTGGSRVRLTREPKQFTELAAGRDELSTRVAAVLARIAWPGKPGDAAVAPLAPEEQRLFDAGRDVYRNICQACHQADGRGQDRLAPTLIDSALALAPADITARIVLNGKEGPIGLMPPIGAAITDDQIASVLTYIRREWGQTGTPVDPETVANVRRLTAGRTRPWKDEELMALIAASGVAK